MEPITAGIVAKASMLDLSGIGLFLLILAALATSAYVKIATVLAMLRAGLGTSTIPGFLITGVLSLGLSFFIMYPVIQRSLTAVDSSIAQKTTLTEIDRFEAIDAGAEVWKSFVAQQAHPFETERFRTLALMQVGEENSTEATSADLNSSWQILAPAFLVSELKEAFATGLSILLPLLIIDLLVAHLLAAMGLMNVNAHVVSFPLKILLFVMVDGWSLITNNLLSTYIVS